MKREMLNKNKNATAKIFTLIFFLFIFVLILRLGYLCLTGKVDGISTDVDLNYYYESNPINVSKVNNPRISNTTHNSIKLNWSKVSNSSGYQIYRSTSKNGSYKKIKTINKNSTLSYTDTNKLSSNKKYYYK